MIWPIRVRAERGERAPGELAEASELAEAAEAAGTSAAAQARIIFERLRSTASHPMFAASIAVPAAVGTPCTAEQAEAPGGFVRG